MLTGASMFAAVLILVVTKQMDYVPVCLISLATLRSCVFHLFCPPSAHPDAASEPIVCTEYLTTASAILASRAILTQDAHKQRHEGAPPAYAVLTRSALNSVPLTVAALLAFKVSKRTLYLSVASI